MGIHCFGCEIPYNVGTKLESNAVFLRDVVENQSTRAGDNWSPEDYGLSITESAAAKNTDTLSYVIQFLKEHNLPWEEKPLR
jgi:hypothetical protein